MRNFIRILTRKNVTLKIPGPIVNWFGRMLGFNQPNTFRARGTYSLQMGYDIQLSLVVQIQRKKKKKTYFSWIRASLIGAKNNVT